MGTLWSCSNIHQLKLICWSSTWSYCQLKKTAHQSHELKVLFGAIWGLQPRRQHLKQLWETVPKTKGEGQYTSNSGEGGVHAIKHVYFLESFCWSQKTVVTMKDFSALLGMRRYKNLTHKVSSWECLTTEDLSCQFPGSTECLISALHSKPFRGVLEVSSFQRTWFNPFRGRWQHPWQVHVCGWH